MMSLPLSISTGDRYGKLTVISAMPTPIGKQQGRYYLCRCDCGRTDVYRSSLLMRKAARGGGCKCGYRYGNTRTHGMTKTRIYNTWSQMKRRCIKTTDAAYPNYGGRGITVCEKWLSFEAFYADMGEAPTDNHTIERIDNDAGYFMGNCRWALRSEQNANTRANHRLTYNGKTLHLAEWSRQTGIGYPTILFRLKMGWSVERALTAPIGPNGPKRKL